MKLHQDLISVLKKDDRFVVDGKLAKNKVIELALQLDTNLLKLLQTSKDISKNFFQEVDNVLVFDKVKFQNFVSNKQFLPDSFTEYKNKIGLTSDKQYITESEEVVLAFPYKDCVLEGGQTKEDSKRSEIFWNETLALDEVDRLLGQKTLTNFKKYDKDGDHSVKDISLEDNLLIKGNNLLVLHSLKKTYNRKVNFIYIDPPYNTGSDSFGYNDSFNRSTWLTFMKNRLEAAKSLMTNDGVIAVQCSFHQQAYLKVLMDEIFPKFLCTFNIQVRHPDRILTGDKEYNDVIEYILLYAINPSTSMPKKIEQKTSEEYVYSIEEIGKPEEVNMGGKVIKIYTPDKYKVVQKEAEFSLFKKISVRGSIREKNSSGRFYVKYLEKLKEKYPAETLFKVPEMGDDAFGDRYFYLPPTGNINGGYYQGRPQSSDTTNKPYPNFFNFEKEYNNVSKQGDVSFRNGKKPEELISFLLNLFTSKNSLVLDYHLGSGTTCAVAHKLGRRYIGIEQMDYGDNDSVSRLRNVINGEKFGISEEVDWQGGGAFVYAELAEANQAFVDKIQNAKNSKAIFEVWEEMKKTAFLSYKIKPEEIDATKKDFENLAFEDQQRLLISTLDKNMLYIPYSEIEDKTYKVSKDDILLNNKFYGRN